MLGREVATLVNELKAPGAYKVTFNISNALGKGTSLSSGTYLYKLTVDNKNSLIKKMLLLK